MQKYRATLSYLGTHFCGWQKQPLQLDGTRSIQEILEECIYMFSSEITDVVASGRTDRGVHASGQVIQFSLSQKRFPPHKIRSALNVHLPKEIRVLEVEEVPSTFHLIRDVQQKQYSYYIALHSTVLPLYAPGVLYIRHELDIKKMSEGLNYVKGSHNFKAFCAVDSSAQTTTRHVFEADITSLQFEIPARMEQAPVLRIRVVASGFLKQMMRGIVGTLIEIGENKKSPEIFKNVLESGHRSHIGPSAPAHGLWLEKVWFVSHCGDSDNNEFLEF